MTHPLSKANQPSANQAVIDRLQGMLRSAIATAVPERDDYILLDFPNHPNIGDSAIYMGEAILLREYFGHRPSLVTEAHEWEIEQVARTSRSCPILIHGGGNFGDIWPHHQKFREAILTRFTDRKVVQLPQSIHFSSDENLRRAAKVINAHPDFTLMVRDEASAAIARSAFTCKIMMVPDMAFMIGAVLPPAAADQKVLCLIREDKETIFNDTNALVRLPSPHLIVDWPEEHGRASMFERLPARLRRLLPPPAQGYRPVTPAAYEWLARRRVETGLRLLSRGEVIMTDRLHAHILAVLLGKPHVTLDNSYGKIGNFMAAFTSDANGVRAETLEQAVDQASRLRS